MIRADLRGMCVATVLAGTVAILAVKAVFETRASNGETFDKPFTMCIVVAAAMGSSLPAWWFGGACRTAAAEAEAARTASGEPLLVSTDPPRGARGGGGGGGEAKAPATAAVSTWVLVPLACSDLTVSMCDNAGMMLAPASTTSMVNCAILLFCAVSTRVVLGTRYTPRQWAGIAVAMTGILLVGAAAFVQDEDDNDGSSSGSGGGRSSSGSGAGLHATLGVCITLAGRLLQSVQFAYEERYMRARRFHPLQQVGAEGCIELLLLAAVVLPAVQALPGGDGSGGGGGGGRLEDVVAALEEVCSTPRLGLLCALAFVGLALLNPLSMSIGKHGGSVLRVFMDVARSALVWLVELGIGLLAGRGGGGGGGYGERWQRSSYVQLVGFVLICVGLWLYTTKAVLVLAAAPPLEKQ